MTQPSKRTTQPSPIPSPSCRSCVFGKTCFLRIELRRTIQSFKFLAETALEVSRTSATRSVEAVYQTVADSCTKFRDEDSNAV